MKETSVRERRSFDETFKREAVQNWLRGGKSAAVVGEVTDLSSESGREGASPYRKYVAKLNVVLCNVARRDGGHESEFCKMGTGESGEAGRHFDVQGLKFKVPLEKSSAFFEKKLRKCRNYAKTRKNSFISGIQSITR